LPVDSLEIAETGVGGFVSANHADHPPVGSVVDDRLCRQIIFDEPLRRQNEFVE
jgi:hypothetical protein